MANKGTSDRGQERLDMPDRSPLSLIDEMRQRVNEKRRRNMNCNDGIVENPSANKSRSRPVDGCAPLREEPSSEQPETTLSHSRENLRDNARSMAAPIPNQVLERVTKNLDDYERQGSLMIQLAKTVKELKTEVSKLSEKRPADNDRSEKVAKKPRKTLPLFPTFDSDSPKSSDESDKEEIGEEPDSSLSNIFEVESEEEAGESDSDLLAELEASYKLTSETGPKIEEQLAKVIDKSLRSFSHEETNKTVLEKHKRPENVPNLQIPTSDFVVWRAFQPKTKSVDAAIQKTVTAFTPAIVPIIKQMELFYKHKKSPKDVPLKEIRQLSQEAFQLFSNAVSTTNQKRRDIIKIDLDSKFQKICDKDYPMSASKLFGDKLETDIKDMDATKKIQLTKYSKNKSHTSSYKSSSYDKNSTRSYNQDFQRGFGHNHRPQTPFWKRKDKPVQFKGKQGQPKYRKQNTNK